MLLRPYKQSNFHEKAEAMAEQPQVTHGNLEDKRAIVLFKMQVFP